MFEFELLGRELADGPYPERDEAPDSWDRRLQTRMKLLGLGAKSHPRALGLFVHRVGRLEFEARNLTDRQLTQAAEKLRARLKCHRSAQKSVAMAFALVREAAERKLGIRHHDVQLLGGWALLHGMVAEMDTGEGKTLCATLAAATAALAGVPVHVITVNDYLASRDAEWMGPIYGALGLTVGTIQHGLEPEARRQAYAADITYTTNKELVFDYLKDRLILGPLRSRLQVQVDRLFASPAQERKLLLRGLHYAIVDEADSVLIDEARTPLIISRSQKAGKEREDYEVALEIAATLSDGEDFILSRAERKVELTERGRKRMEDRLCSRKSGGGAWARPSLRRELLLQALSALHLFHRDRDYLVRDECVEIVDEYTGRTMPDRSWEHGLHQAVEAKEKCPITAENSPIARLSYQRFFRRYLSLSGMTGTAREVSGELARVYGLGVVRIPPNRKLRRKEVAPRIFSTSKEKWTAVVERARELHERGRPVLVGTRSVEASERLGKQLEAAGLPHRVLNARQDQEEAETIARAGEPGSITVATNMAGRGTDIRLSAGVAENGGLHVIASELHEARRIDRQLFGRCGRQGDPGSYEAILSLEDELVLDPASRPGLLRPLSRLRHAVSPSEWLARALFRRAQRRAERRHRRLRQDLLRQDAYLESALGFSGTSE